MMLRFQWNALRLGDRVLVHDDAASDLAADQGIVCAVDTRPGSSNDVGIRMDGSGAVQRPRRAAVHLLPLDRRFECWRCQFAAERATGVVGAAAAA